MLDIFDIKDFLSGSSISLLYTFLVFLIFCILYFFLFIKKKENKIIIQTVEPIIENMDFVSQIKNLDYKNLNSRDFLREVSILFRSYLEIQIGYKDFSKLTLKEILKTDNIDIKYLNLIKDIYYKEYQEIELSDFQKKDIYQKIKNIIVN